MSHLFLGVDGGQSSTTALIADANGRVLGMGRSGPCNHVAASEARNKFIRIIAQCVGEARRAASLEPDSPFEGACLGFSGGPADKDAIIAEILNIKHRFVTHDGLIALTGATSGAPGVITIGGTGSISFGRNAQGRMGRVGGWGFIFGDEGGGFDIVRQALRATLRMEEGWGPQTALHPLLLDAGQARNANELLHKFYTPDFPRDKVAALTPIIERAANEGDIIAADLLSVAAQQLAASSAACRRMIFDDNEPARISWVGGVFKIGAVLERFKTLTESNTLNRVGPPDHGPAAGSLLEAYRAAGLALPKLTDLPAEKQQPVSPS
jgi:N-acetylglucosamine kinase-like BadF-type ATPase